MIVAEKEKEFGFSICGDKGYQKQPRSLRMLV